MEEIKEVKVLCWNIQSKDPTTIMKFIKSTGVIWDAVFLLEPGKFVKYKDNNPPVEKRYVCDYHKGVSGDSQSDLAILRLDQDNIVGDVTGTAVTVSVGEGRTLWTVDVGGFRFATSHAPFVNNDGSAASWLNKAGETIINNKINIWLGDFNTSGDSVPTSIRRKYFCVLGGLKTSLNENKQLVSPYDKICISENLFNCLEEADAAGRVLPKAPKGYYPLEIHKTKEWSSRDINFEGMDHALVPSDHLPIYVNLKGFRNLSFNSEYEF